MLAASKHRTGTIPSQNWVCSFAFHLPHQRNFLLPVAALVSPTAGTSLHSHALHLLNSTHYIHVESGLEKEEKILWDIMPPA